MSAAIDKIYKEALNLPNYSRESLVEKLVISIEKNIPPEIENSHLKEAKKRRDEIRQNKVKPVSGDKGLSKVRAITEK